MKHLVIVIGTGIPTAVIHAQLVKHMEHTIPIEIVVIHEEVKINNQEVFPIHRFDDGILPEIEYMLRVEPDYDRVEYCTESCNSSPTHPLINWFSILRRSLRPP